jgi:hypothetical protein
LSKGGWRVTAIAFSLQDRTICTPLIPLGIKACKIAP